MMKVLMALMLLTSPAFAQRSEFEELGPGHCRDDFDDAGQGEEKPTIEDAAQVVPDNICQLRCGAVPWCTAYDDVGDGCVYYRIEITKSDGTAGGTCYKKTSGVGVAAEKKASGAVQASFGMLAFIGAISNYFM
eukprot:gnl/MRDRNA2_/MRDRNA2_85939_c0_seq1.p2 gnl/MRDRNA2_/MRDRNA2_85939_c0~~gnl/MRDRNA2_/MRDRNA2_85939_c0_seq1.p2  ORF type:complete len:134 (+),score=37.92 gnl/MRDRNA2_/MRDRNA2_85939_c0_seq1:65-466(+)